MHTLLDLRGNIPSFIHVSDGKLHDVHALDLLPAEAGAFFVTRAKSNMLAHRVYSAPVDRATGLIRDLYKRRWPVELFFKWFYGTSDNAVRTQIWIAVSVYVLIAIVRKRLKVEASLYRLLQIFSVDIFEKMPLKSAIAPENYRINNLLDDRRLELHVF